MSNKVTKEEFIEKPKAEVSVEDTTNNESTSKSNISNKTVKYTWYNIFGEKVDDSETFETEVEATRFRELFKKGEKITLAELFYRTKNAGIKIH